MNGKVLAKEMLAAIGGKTTPARKKAFEKMCDAIVKHIQTQGQVVGTTSDGATVTGKVL